MQEGALARKRARACARARARMQHRMHARRNKPFKMPHFSSHRRDVASEQVLHVLKKYPLADIYDLLQCDAHYWRARQHKVHTCLGHRPNY